MAITKEIIQDKLEIADVKAMVAQFHTDEVKKAYAEHLKATALY
jgi:hypothetical protein